MGDDVLGPAGIWLVGLVLAVGFHRVPGRSSSAQTQAVREQGRHDSGPVPAREGVGGFSPQSGE